MSKDLLLYIQYIDNTYMISTKLGKFLLRFLPNLILLVSLILAVLLTIALVTLLERKLMATIQRRRGPNVIGFFGFLQPIADGLKLLLKEIILPSNSNVFVFLLAPSFTFFCSLILWLVIPFDYGSALLQLPYSTLYLLAFSSLGVYGIVFSGWASNSKYAFLGGLRSTSQMISYEVCMSFIFIAIIMMCNSFRIVDIVIWQEDCWFVLPLLPLWIIFFICALAETNRAPFDLPEAEAELVAGYNVEYSSMTFALFFLAEYSNIVLMSTLCTLFFWGGWLPFFGLSWLPISSYFWFAVKVSLHVGLFVWVRASLPRYRYDQLMKLGWKILIPVTTFFVLLVAVLILLIDKYGHLIL